MIKPDQRRTYINNVVVSYGIGGIKTEWFEHLKNRKFTVLSNDGISQGIAVNGCIYCLNRISKNLVQRYEIGLFWTKIFYIPDRSLKYLAGIHFK